MNEPPKPLTQRSTYDQGRLPDPSSDRLLKHAASDFGRRLQAEKARRPDEWEWEAREITFRCLLQWSKDEGCYYPHLNPAEPGGNEHDLTFDPRTNSYLKFTRPHLAGFCLSCDVEDDECYPNTSDPVAYLERLSLHREVFGITMSFVGVTGQCCIVTRQQNVPGRSASVAEISELMGDFLGFELIQNFVFGYANSLSFVHLDQKIVALDLRPANVRVTEDGLPIVIDVICAKLSSDELDVFGRFVTHKGGRMPS